MVFDGSGPLVKRCNGFNESLWSNPQLDYPHLNTPIWTEGSFGLPPIGVQFGLPPLTPNWTNFTSPPEWGWMNFLDTGKM